MVKNLKKKIISLLGIFLIPISLGIPIGIGTYTFYYAKGYSYLLNDPKACINCKSWVQSSHHRSASCNDCHAPNDLIGKWSSKALNGFLHFYAFTTGVYLNPIRIKDFSELDKKEGTQCSERALGTHIPPGRQIKSEIIVF